MRTTQSEPGNGNKWAWSLAAVSACMLIASWGSHLDYSYWKDELVSAAAIRADWLSLYRDWIIPDTAPPLYATFLKAWAAVWGEQEKALRSLSLILTLLSLVVTAWARLSDSRIKSVSTVLFLGLSPTLIGHAQEARNYALALFCSTCLVAIYSKDSPQSRATKPDLSLTVGQALAAVLLSLSHYFGLLFSITATGVHAAFRRDKQSIKLAWWTIAAMLIWPTYHLAIASRAEENLSRVEWINVQPVIGTLQEFLAGVFPIIGIHAALFLTVIGLASLANRRWRQTLRLSFSEIKANKPSSIAECKLLASILIAFVALLIIIDTINPLSTARNYIVALPAVAFLFGDLTDILHRMPQRRIRMASAICIAFILLSLLTQSIQDNLRFTRPLMNYKEVASAINETNACSTGCYATRTYDRLKVYFKLNQLKNLSDAKGKNPGIILGLGSSPSKLKKTMNDFPELSCWEPKQSVHSEVFVLIRDPEGLNLKGKGFTPCKRA